MAVLGLVLPLAACEAGGGDNTITFMAAEYSPQTEPYWENLIEEFEEANPEHTVELQVINWNDIDQEITTRIQTGEQPDILNLNKFAEYALDDLLLPAEDAVSAEVLDDFDEGFAEASSYEGTQYALPFIASTRLLFYNEELFEEAGIEEPPADWDGVREAAAAIDDLDGDAVGYGLPLGPEEAQAEFLMWAAGNNGTLHDGDSWQINSPENTETLEFLSGMVDDGLTQPNPGGTDRTDLFNVFAQGNIGMLNGAVFLPGMVEEQNPDLEYGVAEIPLADAEDPPMTLGVQDFLMAFDNGNDETVNLFLDFFYQEENYTEFLEREGFLPATEGAVGHMDDDPLMEPFIESLPTSEFYPTEQPAWSAVDGAVKEEVGTGVQADADPQEVLDEIQRRAEEASD
ncbi:extracellular solute-binding protein [Nocardiopsis sp. HNM0947]|uniref:Extracellular solute-binding protein n=1 Tax=Nocardiopsis coralli TaxID=2772213 RepID=A0ABR9PB12_9ACTN|nr:extracellular solute-binding protein [Nocardiopsis coralli]MBE3001024.1 extracellular solute-binding protein [Nocardiopsis coralli]